MIPEEIQNFLDSHGFNKGDSDDGNSWRSWSWSTHSKKDIGGLGNKEDDAAI